MDVKGYLNAEGLNVSDGQIGIGNRGSTIPWALTKMEPTADQSGISAEADIVGMTGITWPDPQGGVASGAKYIISVSLIVTKTTAGTMTLNFMGGADGDKGDFTFRQWKKTLGDGDMDTWTVSFITDPVGGAKFGFSMTAGAGSVTIHGANSPIESSAYIYQIEPAHVV
jgi:hypothetical protein